MLHIWSEEEKQYLKDIVQGKHYSEILVLMRTKFGFEYTYNQIKGAISRYKLNTGFNGQFKKGEPPPNKGIKGACSPGCEKGWFKKGNVPKNHRPVGSERIDVDGYTLVKIEEPNVWEFKHKLEWIKHNGNIPEGHVVIFGDRNKQNFDKDNLILLSRRELLIMCKNNLIKSEVDLTKTGKTVADIYIKVSDIKKKEKSCGK